MRELRNGLGFPLEAFAQLRVPGKMFRQDFYSDVAVQPGVAGAIHFAHAAGSSRCDNFIGPQACTRSERHGTPNGRRLYLLPEPVTANGDVLVLGRCDEVESVPHLMAASTPLYGLSFSNPRRI